MESSNSVNDRSSVSQPLLKDATTEAFISSLKDRGRANSRLQPSAAGYLDRSIDSDNLPNASQKTLRYDFVPLSFDTLSIAPADKKTAL